MNELNHDNSFSCYSGPSYGLGRLSSLPMIAEASRGLGRARKPWDFIFNRFHINALGFFVVFRWSVLFFVVAMLFDAFGTTVFMLDCGTNFEIHPLVKWFSIHLGPMWGPLLGAFYKIFAGLVVSVYFRHYARVILRGGSVIAFFAGCYNIWAGQVISLFL